MSGKSTLPPRSPRPVPLPGLVMPALPGLPELPGLPTPPPLPSLSGPARMPALPASAATLPSLATPAVLPRAVAVVIAKPAPLTLHLEVKWMTHSLLDVDDAINIYEPLTKEEAADVKAILATDPMARFIPIQEAWITKVEVLDIPFPFPMPMTRKFTKRFLDEVKAGNELRMLEAEQQRLEHEKMELASAMAAGNDLASAVSLQNRLQAVQVRLAELAELI